MIPALATAIEQALLDLLARKRAEQARKDGQS
jgi:hypothetical protein